MPNPTPWNRDYVSAGRALLWIICLSFVAVGLRNFEEGLSRDAPLYATIARNIARSGDWFYLQGSIPEFTPFAEHPHLGFWVLALVFKVLPAADWSARIPGHLFYIGTLWIFFLYVKMLANEKVAVITVLLLWIWSRFSNFFSTVYLDPGCLFFGLASLILFDLSLRKGRLNLSFAAGFSLALSALYKGLTVLGFLPPLLVLFLFVPNDGLTWRKRLVATALGAVGALLVLAIYIALLRQSSMPNFLETYWYRQMTNRFMNAWQIRNFFEWGFWSRVFQDTYYLFPLIIFSLVRPRRDLALVLPWALLATFCLMYAPAERFGFQYLLLLMPWIAWLLADWIAVITPFQGLSLVKVSSVIAIALVLIGQYIPVRIHTMPPPAEVSDIREMARQKNIARMILLVSPPPSHFGVTSTYAWYTGVITDNPRVADPLPPKRDQDLLLFDAATVDPGVLKRQGWCVRETYPRSTLWLPCKS